jgi:surface antigen
MSSFFGNTASKTAVAVLIGAAFMVSGCTTTGSRSGDRAALLGTSGAAIGAAIGSQHGAGGAIAGGIIGGATGLVLAGILDEIERQQMRDAQIAAARYGRSSSRSFRNSKGQRVHASAAVSRTYESNGVRYRELTTSISRDGGAASTSTVTAREVKSGSKTDWVIE